MKSIKNEKLISRNSKIGQYSSVAGLAIILVAGFFLFQSLRDPAAITGTQQAIMIGATILGFIISQLSMYMGNRWGRSPRPDEKLDTGLKGLPNEFTIYHYVTPVPHFLVSPAGLFVIPTFHQRGQVIFRKNRWRNSGGGFLQGYMRFFGQEGIGRPELEAEAQIHSVRKFLARQLEANEIPEIKAILVFTGDEVEIESNDSPIPAMKPKQLKDYLRQKAKEKAVSTPTLQKIKSLFPDE